MLVAATVCASCISLVLGAILGIYAESRTYIWRFGKPPPPCSRSAFFDMSSVKFPSKYLHPPSYTTRTLVPGDHTPERFDVRFTTVNISATVTGNFKYVGGVLTPSATVVFVPCDADSVGIFDPATSAFVAVDISAQVLGRNRVLQ